jgi:hypothetical protein
MRLLRIFLKPPFISEEYRFIVDKYAALSLPTKNLPAGANSF